MDEISDKEIDDLMKKLGIDLEDSFEAGSVWEIGYEQMRIILAAECERVKKECMEICDHVFDISDNEEGCSASMLIKHRISEL